MINELDFEYIEAAIGAANNTDADGDIVDMAGFDGVLFVTPIVDSVATGVATLTAEGDDVNAADGMKALNGAQAQAVCAENDDLNGKFLIVEVYKPVQRYLRANITSETANIAFGATMAIKYNGHKQPVSPTDVADSAYVASPAQAS